MQIVDEWDDLCYLIKRGRVSTVKEEIRMNQKFHGKLVFRENGDNILHICAEYNQAELFKWFKEEFNVDIA